VTDCQRCSDDTAVCRGALHSHRYRRKLDSVGAPRSGKQRLAGAGNWFLKSAGALIGILGLYFILMPIVS